MKDNSETSSWMGMAGGYGRMVRSTKGTGQKAGRMEKVNWRRRVVATKGNGKMESAMGKANRSLISSPVTRVAGPMACNMALESITAKKMAASLKATGTMELTMESALSTRKMVERRGFSITM